MQERVGHAAGHTLLHCVIAEMEKSHSQRSWMDKELHVHAHVCVNKGKHVSFWLVASLLYGYFPAVYQFKQHTFIAGWIMQVEHDMSHVSMLWLGCGLFCYCKHAPWLVQTHSIKSYGCSYIIIADNTIIDFPFNYLSSSDGRVINLNRKKLYNALAASPSLQSYQHIWN